MAFTIGETQALRYYLGRDSKNDHPRNYEPFMRLDDALRNLEPEAEARIRGHLSALHLLEQRMLDAVACANVVALDGARFDPEGQERMIRRQGLRVTRALAKWLGVTFDNSPFGPLSPGGPTLRG